jgi:hypothetical protein
MIKYVTRIYEVNVPDDESTNLRRNRVWQAIDDKFKDNYEDADIVKSSDNAVALFLSYQLDVGNFTDLVEMYDTTVTDICPDISEFELNE